MVRDPQTGLHRAMYLADGTAVPQLAPEQPTSPLKMAVFRDIGRHWWGEGVLYGIFKETFMGVYMYILYNKGPIEVYIYMLWLSLWFMVMDVTEEEPVFFLNILW